MKRLLSVISAAAVILAMTGCSSAEIQNNAESSAADITASRGTEIAAPAAGGTAGGSSAGTTAAVSHDEGKSEASVGTAAEPVAPDEASSATTGEAETAPDRAETATEATVTETTADTSAVTTVPSFGIDVEEECAAEDSGIFGDYALADKADGLIGGWDGPIEPIDPVDPIFPIIEQPDPQAGLLTGGEWNDNDHWHDWVSLYQSHDDWSSYDEEWGFSLNFRYEVKVTSVGKPVEGAKVTCDNAFAPAVTDNTGTAYLFFDSSAMENQPMNLTVTYGSATESREQLEQKDSTIEIELDSVTESAQKKLDLMIMCDTTGSMSDELSYLQEELISILNSVERNNSNVPTRVSVNFYRDDGDEYVIRDFPFTTDFKQAENQMSEQWADGGGDFPEAVHKALENALKDHDWDEDSVKLMFLVLDAPPHSEDPQIVSYVRQLTALASEMGVRIIPIASSGIDKSTEFLLRNLAFTTGGTYTFLTDDSGVSVGGHIEPTIGDYTVEKLNDMIVRIVSEYLA